MFLHDSCCNPSEVMTSTSNGNKAALHILQLQTKNTTSAHIPHVSMTLDF